MTDQTRCYECGAQIDGKHAVRRFRTGKKWKNRHLHYGKCLTAYTEKQRRIEAVLQRREWSVKNPYRG